MRITVVALGDLGRSPRMQYHALALANSGCDVDLIGYLGVACIPEVEDHKRIHILRSSDPLPGPERQQGFSVFRTLFRNALQHVQLGHALLVASARPAAILIQTPPAIPTLGIAWLAARLRGAKLVVDWHNFSSAMLALKTGASHPAVRWTRTYERLLGRLADSHLCVSHAMKRTLADSWGIRDALVLYDRPAAQFVPLPSQARPGVLRELLAKYVPDTPLWCDDSRRPACLVCPTSWSEDEDLSLLLDALRLLDERIRPAVAANTGLANLLVLITGRGPRRESFEARVAELSLRGIEVHTVWLSASDYPRLLAASDLGLCFHRSASGVDLPMKIADMFGAGLPVCAFDYGPCLAERLVDGRGGLLHDGSQQLADQLHRLFADFPEKSLELEELRRGVRLGDDKSWADGWNETAKPVLLGIP